MRPRPFHLAGLLVAWWLFPVGLAFAAVMVIVIARDPASASASL
ncbi:MAG: hypothetical protein U0641_08120 [Anaerolineae bacterium]